MPRFAGIPFEQAPASSGGKKPRFAGIPLEQQDPDGNQVSGGRQTTASPVSLMPNLSMGPAFTPLLAVRDMLTGQPQAEATGGPGAQQQYDAALAQIRQTQFPDMSDAQWAEYAATALAPYNSTNLMQHGALFGATDEMSAAMGALGSQLGGGPGFGEAFGDYQALEQARRDYGREQQGALGTAAELVGGVAMGMGRAPQNLAGAQTGNRFNQAVNSIGGAIAQGGAYGFGATDGDLDERLLGAGIGASTSGVGAAMLPAVIRGVGAAARHNNQVMAAPAAATIKAASKAQFKAAERTGAVINQNAVNLLNHDVRAMVAAEGLLLANGKVARSYPRVREAVKSLEDYAGADLSIKQAQTVRKQFRGVANSSDKEERRIGAMLLDQLDDFMESLPQSAFTKGDGPEAARLWAGARADYARSMRTDTIEQVISNAKLSRSGFADGVRDEFSKILKNPKRRRGFKDDELDAMRKYVEGGPVDDLLRFIGGGGTFAMGVTGHAVGGPVTAAAMAGSKIMAGAGARRSLDSTARRVTANLRAQVAYPGGMPASMPQSPMIDRVARRIGASAGNPMMDPQRQAIVQALMSRGAA